MGAIIALFPVASLWRASGQALDILPPVAAAQVDDDRHGFTAIWDPEFIVATRIYRGVSAEKVQATLTGAGFETANIAGDPWLVEECCGEHDAVWVGVESDGEGNAVARITMADGDIQLSWVFFAVLGSPLFLGGVAVALLGVRSLVSP